MGKKIRQFAAGLLATLHCFGCIAAFVAGSGSESHAAGNDPYGDVKMRIGLAYKGSSAGEQVFANLWIEDGYAPGFRFGYYNSNLDFIQLGHTTHAKITMTKAKNLYLVGTNYYDEMPGGSYRALGSYHLQMPGSFTDYDLARSTAKKYQGSFIAWKDGKYYIRANAYTTPDAAWTGAGQYADGTWTVVQPGNYAVNVVVYATTEILFQFDGGASYSLGVKFGHEDKQNTRAWFLGYRYYGGMRFQRLNGGNMTVVNIVPLDTYVKGVVPYESYQSWPIDTLKAQALCAKNYGLTDRGKHGSSGFDVCNTTDCQVYRGYGNERVSPNAMTDRAVDETSGIYIWYNGKLARTYFYASNGGGSEDVKNVWGGTSYPYLCGVEDPYEADVADVALNYNWSYSFTKEELTQILQERGYASGTTVELFEVTQYSATGNVLEMKFTYANGMSNTFKTSGSSWLRNKLGCRSIHFTVSGSGEGMPQGMPVNDGTGSLIETLKGMFALSGNGLLAQIRDAVPYIIVGDGEIVSSGRPSTIPSDTYVITGTGWGHNVGYSQWGGYAMALRGYSYDEILKFYYPGVVVGRNG